MKKITTYLILTFYFGIAHAAPSLGDVSQAAMGPLSGVKKMLVAISTIAGLAFLMGAAIQYKDHRKNPIQVTLSKPIVYLILSIMFLVLPHWTQLSQTAKVFLK